MNHQLFQFAIFHTPVQNRDQLERGEQPQPTIVVQPTTILAKNEQEAQLRAARAIPEQYAERLDQLTIAVSAF